jgi:cytochrome c oxidase subunit 4
MGANHNHGSDEHHIIPISTYQKILGILLVMTVLTVAVAKPVSGFDAGVLNAAIAMAIASIKAVLVLAIFMHLKYDKKLNIAIFVSGIFFLVVLYLFSILDIYSRIPVDSTL